MTESPLSPPRTPSRAAALGRRLLRRLLSWLAVPALILLASLAASRGEAGRRWLLEATGEESWWEGVKGTVALAGLTFGGPRLELAPDEPILHKETAPYGVNVFLQLEADPDKVRRSFAMMHDAGIAWARQQFPWEDIEIHARGDFQDRRNEPPRSAWDKYDRIVQEAQNHQVRLLVRLDDPPEWAYADPAAAGAQKGPPSDYADYANFVAAVVKRYCGRVQAYQLWNEPNIYPEWGGSDAQPATVDPAGYAALLKVAAAAARGACADVVIISAALAPTTEPGGRNMHDLRYLEGLYKAGWQGDFDILAVQGFGLWTGPQDQRVSENRTNFARPMLARDIMVRAGDSAKPVWISEFGWDSPPPDMEAPYGRVDEATRAAYTTAAYQRMARDWPWVGVGFLWFFRRPDMEWHQRPEGYFRLVEPDWTALPSYQALKDLAEEPPLLNGGRHRPDDHALLYSGPWRDELLDGRLQSRVGLPGAELDVSFRGTGFELWLQPAPAAPVAPRTVEAPPATSPPTAAAGSPAASARPEASDAPPGARDSEAGPAVGDPGPPLVTLVVDGEDRPVQPESSGGRYRLARGGLPLGEHRVLLRVDGGEFALEELRIAAPEPVGPLRRPLQWLGLALALALVIALTVALRRARRARRAGTSPLSPGPSVPLTGQDPPAVEDPGADAVSD